MPKILVSHGHDQKLLPYRLALEACGLTASDLIGITAEETSPVPGRELLDGARGLLLSGGNDLEPHLFGQTPIAEARLDPPVPDRDRMELELVAAAQASGVPVLAICRGLQLLNVHLGGTLWQDLPLQAGVHGHDRPASADWPLGRAVHSVEPVPPNPPNPPDQADPPLPRSPSIPPIAPGTRVGPIGPDRPIRRWLGDEPIEVNSRHHQAVRRAGKGLTTAGIARDGVIEAMAFEDPAWWAWGVQWHPENMFEEPRQRRLFVEFLSAAEAHR